MGTPISYDVIELEILIQFILDIFQTMSKLDLKLTRNMQINSMPKQCFTESNL